MNTEKRICWTGHIWVSVLVAVASFVAGIAFGFFAPCFVGPSAQRIADGLSMPLPIPNGAKLLKQFGPDSGSGITFGAGNRYFFWRTGIALNITNMTKAQVEAIPEFYESYFNKALPDELAGFRWYTSGGDMAATGFTRFPAGQMPPEGWTIVSGGAWTWRMWGNIEARNVLCEVHAEVMDFDHLENSAMWKKIAVLDLNSPIKEQRVMYVRLRLRGQGLRNVQRVKWPPKPTTYTPTPDY
jgi:hypothetical protein